MRKSGFSKHHRKIKIEGTDLPGIVNKCIRNGILLKDLRYRNELESTADLKDDDYDRLKKLAGHSYRMTTIDEGGIIPFFRKIKSNIPTIIGAFLLGALIFYQSLFIAEIRVDGYRTITETDIRQTLEEAGLKEGARKPENYDHIKARLFETYPKITWVSVYENGKLIKVNIAEAGKAKDAEEKDMSPVHIIAKKSGMVDKITPLQGNARVQKGDYVNKGDVLISGRYKYQSSDYSKGDGFFYMYSHAEGQVLAKIPRQVTFYMQKVQRREKLTGKVIPGLFIKIGDAEIDTAHNMNRFKTSLRKEKKLMQVVRPLPVRISLVTIYEVIPQRKNLSAEKRKAVTEAAIRQYKREELKKGEEIISYDIEFSETENLVKADVFMEVLEDIGEDRKIEIKKVEKTEKR